MAAGRPRVAVFSELPTPYRWPVFERLLRSPWMDLRVFFLARGEADRDFEFPFEPGRGVRFLPGRTFAFRGRRSFFYHFNPGVVRTLAAGRFDVAVFPGWAMFASHAGALWCRWRRRRYVLFSESHDLAGRGPWRRLARRLVLPALVGHASAWLATGRLAAAHLAGLGADPARIRMFPNSPDVEAIARAAAAERTHRAERRRALGLAEGPVVAFVGRLIGVKRVDLLLSAVRGLPGNVARPAIVIAGDGPERSGLSDLARGLEVSFLGSVPSAALPGLLTAADVLVLPSDHEPWGAVVGEAMACGLPVVASDRVGCGPDLVLPGETGEVFRHGDAGDLAERLARLLANPPLLRRMGESAERHVAAFGHAYCAAGFESAVRLALATET